MGVCGSRELRKETLHEQQAQAGTGRPSPQTKSGAAPDATAARSGLEEHAAPGQQSQADAALSPVTAAAPGVHISVLQDLLRRAGTENSDLTTTQVCAQVVQPATKELSGAMATRAYLRLVEGQSAADGRTPLVRPATHFVSHAWRYTLATVVATLEELAAEEAAAGREAYFWFDLVCNAQHGTVDRPFEWWQTTFRDSIAAIGRVVLVLAPWSDPIPLTRVWCLFEIFSAATTEGVALAVRLPPTERPAFEEALAKSFSVVMDTLVRVQSERAEAFLAADKERIHAAVKASAGGHAQLDALVKDQLRAWLLQATLAAAQAREAGTREGDADELKEAAARLYHNAAAVANTFGQHAEALEYYSKSLAIRREVLGERHPDTATTYNSMAVVLKSQGKHAEALEYHEKSLTIRREVLGERHPDTASTYNSMANVISDQGRHAEALDYWGKSLAIRREVLGERHPDTAATYNNMANIFRAQGKHAEAMEYYDKSLAIRREVLGEHHPDTAATYNNMGEVFRAQGKYAEALEYYGKDLAITREVLGECHPSTAMTYNNMASVFDAQGRQAEALEYYGKSLAIHREVLGEALGERHPDTAASYEGMANVFGAQGKHAEALAYYEKSLAIRREVLGERHPEFGDTCYNMALLSRAQGDSDRARELFAAAHAAYLASYGPDHSETLDAAEKMCL